MQQPNETALSVLDLTNAHRHDLQEVEIPPSLTEIDLTCNRLASIDARILDLRNLKSLSFRQNLLSDAHEVTKIASKSTLEYLELRDNQFEEIPDLTGFSKLQGLEISYNQIRSMRPLSSLTAVGLESLFLASNKITSIESLQMFSSLKLLELGFNRIRRIENIGHLEKLEELWLGRNRIPKIENLTPLTNLKKLSLQSNRLESMNGLGACFGLEEVYLSHNGITRLEGLESLTQLRVLDVSNNRLKSLECLETLVNLQDLWLNDNQLDSWDEVYHNLEASRATLSTIYLENNPLAEHPNYKTRVRAILPNLTQLDADDLVP